MIQTFGFENKIAGICNLLVQTYGYFLAEVIVPLTQRFQSFLFKCRDDKSGHSIKPKICFR